MSGNTRYRPAKLSVDGSEWIKYESVASAYPNGVSHYEGAQGHLGTYEAGDARTVDYTINSPHDVETEFAIWGAHLNQDEHTLRIDWMDGTPAENARVRFRLSSGNTSVGQVSKVVIMAHGIRTDEAA